MSVPDQETANFYEANGVTTNFPYGFYLLTEDDLVVTLNSEKVTSGYSVTGVGSKTGGSVIFTTAPADGASVLLERQVALERSTDYQPNGDLRSEVLNTDFDRIWMVLQDKRRENDRSLRYPNYENINGLMAPAASRAGTVLGFADNGVHTFLPMPSTFGAGDRVPYTLIKGVDFNTGDLSVTLPRPPGAKGNLEVHWDGSAQDFTEWDVDGVTLSFNNPIPDYITKIWGYIGTTLSIETPPHDSVGDDELTWGDSLTRVCDSIAELRALPKSRYKVARTLGYYARGDRGHAHYYQDGSDTTSPDNGGSVIVADDGARWKIVIIGDLNIRQFGAKGDGVTIDTTPIRKAVAASVGRRLYIPPGTERNDAPFLHNPYLIDDEIELDNTSGGYYLYGGGWCWDNNWGAVGGGLIKNVNALGKHAFKVTGARNGLNVFTDFGILGNGLDGDGINGTDLYNTHIDKMLITGQGGYCVRLIESFNSRVFRCLIGNTKKTGLYLNGLANGVSVRDNVFFGCDGLDGGFACMEVDGVGGNSLDVLIDGNTFEPNTGLSTHCFGLVARATDGIVVKGNYFELFPTPGGQLYFDANVRGFDVQGNYFQDGPVEFAQSTFGTIDNNVFQRVTYPTTLIVSPPLIGANRVRIGLGNVFIGGATKLAPEPFGTATMVAGVAIVPHSNANSGVPIIASHASSSGTTGQLFIGTIVNGVSFEIRSTSATDNSAVNWHMPGY